MTKKRVVITGAPGTGKTSVIHKLEASGYFCFHEVIRTMTQELKKNNGSEIKSNPIVSTTDPHLFNSKILDARVQQFNDALTNENSILFYDRGIPDVLAYMNYFNQKDDHNFITQCKACEYDHIFILPPWKEIYTSDEERFETFEQAEDIHHHLFNIYTDLGYQCIKVPFGSVEQRTDFILQRVL